ncbi:MAG: hypothetical protein PHI59_00610 [Candidatus Omnitrophica bacterium]|nr:hypothetical protein [Candidatus Omnitrophota bacterium]
MSFAKGFPALAAMFGIAVIAFLFSYFYTTRLRVIIEDDFITIKMPDKATKINIKDIYRIDREAGGGGGCLYFISYEENGKKKMASFSDQIEGYHEIVNYIEQRRPKHHPLSRRKPYQKIFRTIFLIIMYSLMFGVPLFVLLCRK